MSQQTQTHANAAPAVKLCGLLQQDKQEDTRPDSCLGLQDTPARQGQGHLELSDPRRLSKEEDKTAWRWLTAVPHWFRCLSASFQEGQKGGGWVTLWAEVSKWEKTLLWFLGF